MNLRAAFRLLLMAKWLAFCVICHVAVRPFARSNWPRRLLRGIGWIAGARVTTDGPLPSHGTLIVANHVSWLDIPLLAGATDTAFVAKDGLKGHPIMRWLCEQNGTVFVEREKRGTIGDQLAGMEAALRTGKPLCLFPEGTVGDGGTLLPFRPALLAIAEQPSAPTVQPVAVNYGAVAPEFGWPAGESGTANFLRLLGRKGTVAVTLRFLPPLPAGEGRKALAAQSHAAIAAALEAGGAPLDPVEALAS